MKRFIFFACIFASSLASADPLADANTLFANKSYPEALRLYTKLANAGNVEAQQHLGEMYWYGEAGVTDEAQAEAWFRKAAAKSNPQAIASLAMIKRRAERRAEIDYWVEQYDGEDLKSGKFHCPVPRIPAISRQAEEVARITASIATWQNCYNDYVTNLNAAMPLVQRIPADIAKLLNKAETERAHTRLELVQENLQGEARVSSAMVLADLAVWRKATEAYVAERNLIIGQLPSAERLRAIEARKTNYAPPGR